MTIFYIVHLNVRTIQTLLSSDTLDFIMTLPSCELLNVMMGGSSDIVMRIWDKSVYVKFVLISVRFPRKKTIAFSCGQLQGRDH